MDTDELSSRFLEVRIMLAPIPNHPLNAESLHKDLVNLSLPERDERWTIPLQRSWRDDGSIREDTGVVIIRG